MRVRVDHKVRPKLDPNDEVTVMMTVAEATRFLDRQRAIASRIQNCPRPEISAGGVTHRVAQILDRVGEFCVESN